MVHVVIMGSYMVHLGNFRISKEMLKPVGTLYVHQCKHDICVRSICLWTLGHAYGQFYSAFWLKELSIFPL